MCFQILLESRIQQFLSRFGRCFVWICDDYGCKWKGPFLAAFLIIGKWYTAVGFHLRRGHFILVRVCNEMKVKRRFLFMKQDGGERSFGEMSNHANLNPVTTQKSGIGNPVPADVDRQAQKHLVGNSLQHVCTLAHVPRSRTKEQENSTSSSCKRMSATRIFQQLTLFKHSFENTTIAP